jgi:predicted O-linked N-acetylglucosamine transferase (SPINDLY family)
MILGVSKKNGEKLFNESMSKILYGLVIGYFKESNERIFQFLKAEIDLSELPYQAELLILFSRLYHKIGINKGAIEIGHRAINLKPGVADFYNCMGVFYEAVGKDEVAEKFYKRAWDLEKDNYMYALNYANIYNFKLSDQSGMFEINELLFRVMPKNSMVFLNAAWGAYRFGFRQKAIELARQATAINMGDVRSIFNRVAYTLPVTYLDADDILNSREMFERELNIAYSEISNYLIVKAKSKYKFEQAGWQSPFFLAYQGMNDKDLMVRYSQTLARALSPDFGQYLTRISRFGISNGKIRLGFCTSHFYKHSIWKIPLCGLYKNINRDKFEIYSFHNGGPVDAVTDEVRHLSDRYIRLEDVNLMAECIIESKLDVLVFPELGMDPRTFILSMMRLAPVQCQMLGHPVTSGSSAVDYVISSDLMEPRNGQEHYSENLVRIPGLGITYDYEYKYVSGEREDFGLSEDDVVFLTPQTIMKYLPQYDFIFPEIALGVPSAKFIFVFRSESNDKKIFLDRLHDAFARVGLRSIDHVLIFDVMSEDDFMRLCNSADIFLNNISWSGHNTILDALNSRTRVISMWGDAMRSNHGAAILKFIGLDRYIAYSISEFIEKCIFYSLSDSDRCDFESDINDRLALLRKTDPVRAIEEFFQTVVFEGRGDHV